MKRTSYVVKEAQELQNVCSEARKDGRNICLFDTLKNPDPEFRSVFIEETVSPLGIGAVGVEEYDGELFHAYESKGFEDTSLGIMDATANALAVLISEGLVSRPDSYYEVSFYSNPHDSLIVLALYCISKGGEYYLVDSLLEESEVKVKIP